MALINCPECGKDISDKALSCPNCGCPIGNKKFCKFCGEKIAKECVVCPKCGKQVENIVSNNSNIFVNNSSSASAAASAPAMVNTPIYRGKPRDKWVALCLCIFLGFFGVHKFYEGKIGIGILYIFTMGLFGIGWIIDIIILVTKSNPYYV